MINNLIKETKQMENRQFIKLVFISLFQLAFYWVKNCFKSKATQQEEEEEEEIKKEHWEVPESPLDKIERLNGEKLKQANERNPHEIRLIDKESVCAKWVKEGEEPKITEVKHIIYERVYE